MHPTVSRPCKALVQFVSTSSTGLVVMRSLSRTNALVEQCVTTRSNYSTNFSRCHCVSASPNNNRSSFLKTFTHTSKKYALTQLFSPQAQQLLQTSCQAKLLSTVSTNNMHSGEENEDFLFRQLLEYKSYTFSYLLADLMSNEAILIDPVIDTVERDVRIVKDLGLNVVYAANTHVHADHITGTGELKKRLPTCKSMIAEASGARADVLLKEGDKVPFGRFELEVRSTPGHTDGCLTYVWHEKGMVFTGDALLIKGCGRTDFQQGNASVLYDSVHRKIFSLPRHYKVFPAHDYTGQMMSTVGEELRFNPRLTKPKHEFVEVMEKLGLPYPKQIEKAVPANMLCGVYDDQGKLVT